MGSHKRVQSGVNNGKGEIHSRGSEGTVALGSFAFNASLAFLHQSCRGVGGSEWCWACRKVEMLDVVCPCHQWGNDLNSAHII